MGLCASVARAAQTPDSYLASTLVLNFNIIFFHRIDRTISSGVGERNTNSTPAQSPARCGQLTRHYLPKLLPAALY
jgi:hypothetical protein